MHRNAMASRQYLNRLSYSRSKRPPGLVLSGLTRRNQFNAPTRRPSSTLAKLVTPWPSWFSHSPEQPRSFPTTGFDLIHEDIKIEEEEILGYEASRLYPVRLGQVFQDRYQAVSKLGFGSSSTIWLARDMRERQYVALKIYAHTSRNHRELPAYEALSPILAKSKHHGRNNIRLLLDAFEMSGPDGRHKVLVLEASQMSLRDLKFAFMKEEGFDCTFVKWAIKELLKALDFIHTEAQLVHTDIHPGNLLLGLDDDTQLQPLVDIEFRSPVARKEIAKGRTIYLSRLMRPNAGPVLLSDFGEARSGPGPHAGDIMPIRYRAPEIIMGLVWNEAVDIWSVGLTAWDLLGPSRLFTAKDDAAHLAELIATLGAPPAEFLQRHPKRAADFWDEKGKWLGLAPIPKGRSLEELETGVEDSTSFISFLRRVLTWTPEDRPTARELLQHPWLTRESERR